MKYERKIHEMKLSQVPFTQMESGLKTIEVRLYDEKRQLLNLNDIIIFTNTNNSDQKIDIKIIGLCRFITFEDMFENINGVQMGWNVEDSTEQKIKDMRKFYSEQEEKEYGVLCIYFKKNT